MKKLQNKKSGFTLIELLVVITIIGILATGATATYTAQIQRARDSTRITDINAMRNGIEQLYQEISRYPNADDTDDATSARRQFSAVQTYVETFPEDPKKGESCNGGTPCDYLYSVGPDNNTIASQFYVVSTAFENEGNVNSRGNSGDDSANLRLEMGTGLVGTAPTAIFNNTNGVNIDGDILSCAAAFTTTSPSGTDEPYMLIRGNCPE